MIQDNRDTMRMHIAAQIAPIAEHLHRPDVFEVCVNEPGAVWVETARGWVRHEAPILTFERLLQLASAVATFSAQWVDGKRPLLSATLPDGERIQIVMPPAVAAGTISMTIRKPSSTTFSLAELGRTKLFSNVGVNVNGDVPTDDQEALSSLLYRLDFTTFLGRAVRSKQNIIISGATGSGKTTLAKALIQLVPDHERIITIEDTLELDIPQPNHVRLFYSKGGQGTSNVRAKDLLEACLRMRPDRIMLQELRDGTAFDYLRNVNSGHPGSITTVHANSCELAFEQLTLLVKESEGGRGLDRHDIRQMLAQLIDVVVQCKRVDGEFRVSEIWFSGDAKRVSALT